MPASHAAIITLAVAIAIVCGRSSLAQDKPQIDVGNAKDVQLSGANCVYTCALSAAFAPDIDRKRAAAITISNNSDQDLEITPSFRPDNGLAAEVNGGNPFAELKKIIIKKREKQNLTVAILSGSMSAGEYTGELILTQTDGPTLATLPVSIHVRASVVWAIGVALLGIVVGRISQLVYDPKMVARVGLYDWLVELEDSIEAISDVNKKALLKQALDALRLELGSRNADVGAITTKINELADNIGKALQAAAAAAAAAADPGKAATASLKVSRIQTARPTIALRWFAGVTPLPLSGVYGYLLPALVLVTLIVLTTIFVAQLYGSANTFGSNGISDYLGLFLAGVASDAIAAGPRALRLRSS